MAWDDGYPMRSAPTEAALVTDDSIRQDLRPAARRKGRQPDEDALAEVQALLGSPPAGGHASDWLLEYLHRLDESWGGLHLAHLAALAQELGLPLEQVLAVASRCGQFTVLREGEQPAALRLTVCSGLPCAMAGADALRCALPPLLPQGVALAGSACLGRCQQAPAMLVGEVPVAPASAESVLNVLVQEAARAPGQMGRAHGAGGYEGYDSYRAGGGYTLAAALANGQADAGEVLRAITGAGLQDSAGAISDQRRGRRACPRRGGWWWTWRAASPAPLPCASSWNASRTASSRVC